MNVLFHQLAGIAIAHETATHLIAARTFSGGQLTDHAPLARASDTRPWALACLLAIGSHGILDALPHHYLPSAIDAVGSIALVALWLRLWPRAMRLRLFAVCLASLLPDIVDHVPEDLRRNFGLDVPVPANLFPWHWPSNKSSLPGLHGPLWRESLTYHLIVLGFTLTCIVRTRHLLSWRRQPAAAARPGAGD